MQTSPSSQNLQIYFERQASKLCLQHAINALLQGPYFTAVDLSQIAAELDALELQMMQESGVDSRDFLKFMSEESGNRADDGDYSEQVLQKGLLALCRAFLDLIRQRSFVVCSCLLSFVVL